MKKILLVGTLFSLLLFWQMMRLNAQSITVDMSTQYQSISGFGGINMIGWSGITDMTADQTVKAFGNAPGQLGLSILRIRVPYDSTQFSLNVKTAVLADSLGAKVFATPWSPPPYLKNNNNIVGGYLLPANYGAFANYLLSFVSFMKNNGAPLYGISLQNEPDVTVSYESCDWTAKQFNDFLKQQGSKFDSIKLIAPESYHFSRPLTDSILNDSAAAQYVDIIGGHIYGGGLFDYPLARSKGKEVWMTEHYTESSNSANLWPLALDVATEVNNCMKANFNAYVWWYIRRYYGLITDDGNISKRGYVMSQFSKFIRPGAIRVDAVVASAPKVDVSAYKTDSTIAIVVINTDTNSVNLSFTIRNGTVDNLSKYTTSATKNVHNDGKIPVSAGTFNATVDASSITTFATYNATTSGIVNTDPATISVFPNPAHNELHISWNASFNSLAIIDMQGRKVVRKKYNFFMRNIDLTLGLEPGLYFLQLSNKTSSGIIKLLIE